MAVTFADCRADQIEPLRSFLGEMYSPTYVLARDEAFLRWQFGAVPSADRSGLDVKLGLVDGQIAGCVGYIPVEFSIGSKVVRGAWAANWMVDDRYRRLGLGPLLMRELAAQFDVTLALGGNRDAHALLPRMGWTDFGDLPRFAAVLNPKAAAQLMAGVVLDAPAVSAHDSTDVEIVNRFAPEVAELWDRMSDGAAGTRRTAEYLNWRYADHPDFAYRLLQSRRHGKVNGLAVYRVELVRDLPVKVGRIVEVIAEADDAGPLLQTIAHSAFAEGLVMLDFFCSMPHLRQPLMTTGFSPELAAQLPMLFQPLDRSRTGVLFMAHLKKCPEASAIDRWYVTTADGDQDRPS